MAKINKEKLESAIARGVWTARDVREALAGERTKLIRLAATEQNGKSFPDAR